MKTKRVPFVGFYLLLGALGTLIAAFVLAGQTFRGYSYDLDRYLLVLSIFAIWVLVIQLVMSFVDRNKPKWTQALDLAYCVMVVFCFAKLLIPFLSPIGIYFTVNMGDMETYAYVVPRCIAGCVLYVLSCAFFIAASFLDVVKFKEARQ